MRSQLVAAGLSIAALGVFFLALEPFFAVPAPLSLAPSAGPPGTSVNASASGVPAGSRVYLYWFGRQPGNATYFFLVSGVAGEDGRVPSLAFQVPQAFYGVHNVTASSAPLGPTSASMPPSEVVAVALFNVTASSQGSTATPSEPSPITTWGALTIAAGLVLAGAGVVAKEKEGRVEPPMGTKFCVYCSTPVPLAAERCPNCNGLQPKE